LLYVFKWLVLAWEVWKWLSTLFCLFPRKPFILSQRGVLLLSLNSKHCIQFWTIEPYQWKCLD
jgi:hypothetical protein